MDVSTYFSNAAKGSCGRPQAAAEFLLHLLESRCLLDASTSRLTFLGPFIDNLSLKFINDRRRISIVAL
jgi:hypothetical protein